MSKQWWEPEIYKIDNNCYNLDSGFDDKYESEYWSFGCKHLEDAESRLRGMYKEVLNLRKQNVALISAAKEASRYISELSGDWTPYCISVEKKLRAAIELAEKGKTNE